MFGLLQGSSCRLSPDERQDWMGHVCGVCLALRQDHGQLARLTTNYDAALLSVLYEAQSSAPPLRTNHFCPLRRGGRAAVVDFGQPGARYGAAISALIGATKIADHVADGEGWLRFAPRAASGVARRWTSRARHAAQDLGFHTEQIETQTGRQFQLERQKDAQFFDFSQPTELAVGAAFRHTAVLASCPANAAPLEQIGRMYGRMMYLLDSYRDYASDLAGCKFNALARCFEPDEIQRRASELFLAAHAHLAQHFEQLTLPRPNLARKLLLQRLKQVGTLTLGKPVLATDHSDAGSTFGLFNRRRKPHKDSWCNWCDCCDCCHCCDCCDCCRHCDGNCCDCNCCDCNCCDCN